MGFCNGAMYCCLIFLSGVMQLFISLWYISAYRLMPPACTACTYLTLKYGSVLTQSMVCIMRPEHLLCGCR